MIELVKLEVRVGRVFFPPKDKESDFYIFETDKCVCKGKMSWRPEDDELLLLEGTHGVWQGKPEFKFKNARTHLPVEPYDQLRYACEITKGIGESMCMRIWEEWGADWQDLMEPDVIPRLKGVKYDNLVETVEVMTVKREQIEIIAWLMGKGATTNMAQAAWDRWAMEASSVVNTNCYRLADLPNYGFQDVDKEIRRNFGIDDDDPRRIDACILYCLKRITGNGSTVSKWEEVGIQVISIIGSHNKELTIERINSLFKEGLLIGFGRTGNIALKRDYKAARSVINYLNEVTE